MSLVVGYPTPRKPKARRILTAFCAGMGGQVVAGVPRRLRPGAAAFYGVTSETVHLYRQARAEGRDIYYIDNAYFDSAREVYFRVTRNALQWDGRGASDGERFARLGITIQPWREPGRHVLLCPQSADFMSVVCDYRARPGSNWAMDSWGALQKLTNREIRIRPWRADKRRWFASLHEDLSDCWCVVVYSSSSATSAMLAGVPAICTAQDCISRPLIGAPLAQIAAPPMPSTEARLAWAQVAADHQWTLPEMRSGKCWAQLQGFGPLARVA